MRLFSTQRKGGDPTEYTHGVPQVLFLINHAGLNAGTPVVKQLVADQRSAAEAIEQLYLATLSRQPSENEQSAALRYAEQQPSLSAALDGILWTLVNRSEFVVNH